MWSTNLESQAEFARQRYADQRSEATRWRAQRKAQSSTPRRWPGAALAGRWLAHVGSRLVTVGERWQRAAADHRVQMAGRHARRTSPAIDLP